MKDRAARKPRAHTPPPPPPPPPRPPDVEEVRTLWSARRGHIRVRDDLCRPENDGSLRSEERRRHRRWRRPGVLGAAARRSARRCPGGRPPVVVRAQDPV